MGTHDMGYADLPYGLPTTPVGSVLSHDRYVKLPLGRTFDAYGAEQANPLFPHPLKFKVLEVVPRTTQTALDPPVNLDATLIARFRQLRGYRGKRLRLFRLIAGLSGWFLDAGIDLDDGYVLDSGAREEWCWARLKTLDAPQEVNNIGYQQMDMDFDLLSLWQWGYRGLLAYDSTHHIDDGYVIDGIGPLALTGATTTGTYYNNGNADVHDIMITLTVPVGGGSWTRFEVRHAEFGMITDVAWINTLTPLTAGDVLVIDCGAKAVTLNGVGVYAAFNENVAGDATDLDWLVLPPGTNTLTFTLATGGAMGPPYPDVQLNYWQLEE